ncbi:NADH dehydrogenase [ubiquinone] 1 beta subcomplex subunit 6 [Lemmus lemmus]
MTGYTPDEKLRLQQLRELRRRWLKDQELSPREPVLPPRRMWPLEGFWNNFLRDGAGWKNVVSEHRSHSRLQSTPPLGPIKAPPCPCPGGLPGTVCPGSQV